MYLTILALPLLGAATSGLLGRKLGVTGAQLITCACMITAALLSIVAFYEVALSGSPVSIHLSSWVDSGMMSVDWAFMFDSLTVSMLLPVLIVSSMVHVYSISYMSADPHNQRFFSYLSMFTFFMLILVAGDNYLILFVGWEGIGVSSYLLINFWFTRIQANKSAIKAMVVNRVGDTFLSVAFFVVFWAFGNLDYATVFSLSPYMNETVLTIVGLLFLFAAMGKSAQLGLHTWLPDAMEGPTPVSALIHAATLVTAGVYLLLRSSPLLEYAPTTLVVITWVGAVTAFFAATTGLLQNDIKRVIAYSTCSQMGYLFMAVGISQYSVALFHLVNHAFFKAVLFLAAGGVLHSMADQQDMRRLGGLINLLPFTYTIILIGSLSLMAIPFMTGFYSKDLILESGYAQYAMSGQIVYWLGTITAMITAFYSFRLISMTFLTTPNAPKGDYEHTHEQPLIVMVPLIILALMSIFFGYIAKDSFVGMGSDMLATSLFVHPSHITLVEAEFAIPTFYKLLPAGLTILGLSTAIFLYNFAPQVPVQLALSTVGRKLYVFFNAKWFFDAIITHYIINVFLNIGNITAKVLDRGAIELIGPFGLTSSGLGLSRIISSSDSSRVTDYALYIMIGLLLLILLLFTGSDLRLLFILLAVVLFASYKSNPLLIQLSLFMICAPIDLSVINDYINIFSQYISMDMEPSLIGFDMLGCVPLPDIFVIAKFLMITVTWLTYLFVTLITLTILLLLVLALQGDWFAISIMYPIIKFMYIALHTWQIPLIIISLINTITFSHAYFNFIHDFGAETITPSLDIYVINWDVITANIELQLPWLTSLSNLSIFPTVYAEEINFPLEGISNNNTLGGIVVNQLLDQAFEAGKTMNIPVNLSDTGIKASKTLIDFINVCPSNSPVIDFLTDMKLTPISCFYNSMNGNTHSFDVPVNTNVLLDWNNKSGVYMFTHKPTSHSGIGSALDLAERYAQHYTKFSVNPTMHMHTWVANNGGVNSLSWSPLLSSINLRHEFLVNHPLHTLTVGESNLLASCSVYPNRILEQALQDYKTPFLNGRSSGVLPKVTFFNLSMSPNTYNATSGTGVVFELYDINGVFGKATSWADLQEVTGRTHRVLNRVLNYFPDSAIDNPMSLATEFPEIGKSGFVRRVGDTVVHSTLKRETYEVPLQLAHLLLTDLDSQYIYAFESDLTTIHGKYSTRRELFTALYPSKLSLISNYSDASEVFGRMVSKRINLELPNKTDFGVMFFASHPEFGKVTTIPILVVDTNSWEAEYFQSIYSCSKSDYTATKRAISTAIHQSSEITRGFEHHMYLDANKVSQLIPELQFTLGIKQDVSAYSDLLVQFKKDNTTERIANTVNYVSPMATAVGFVIVNLVTGLINYYPSLREAERTTEFNRRSLGRYLKGDGIAKQTPNLRFIYVNKLQSVLPGLDVKSLDGNTLSPEQLSDIKSIIRH